MPNNLFNNWCIHESSTVYLKLLRYKLVTMFKEKKKKYDHLQLCCFKRGTAFLLYIETFLCTCTTKNSVTPVRSHLVHRLTSSHQFSGHFRRPTVKVNAFIFFFSHLAISTLQSITLQSFCCYCVMLFLLCHKFSRLSTRHNTDPLIALLCFFFLFSFLFSFFFVILLWNKECESCQRVFNFLWITF